MEREPLNKPTEEKHPPEVKPAAVLPGVSLEESAASGEAVDTLNLSGPPAENSKKAFVARLFDPRLQGGQRRALASQMGQAGGNQYLQRAAAFQRESGPANGNARVQRKEEAPAEDKKPTDAERAAALAAARAAEAIAGQAHSAAKSDTAKSVAEGAAETAAGKAMHSKVQQATSEAKSLKGEGAAGGAKHMAAAEGAKAGAAIQPNLPPGGGTEAIAPEAGAAPAPGQKAPANPQDDSAFQGVARRIKGVTAHQKMHPPAGSKAAAAQAASSPPAGEVASKAQANQVGQMQQTETPGFNATAFKAKLMERIQALAPKTMKEADELKEGNKLGGLKGDMKGSVAQEKGASQDPLQKTTQAAPDTSSVQPKPVTPLAPAEPGAAPGSIGAQGAAPKPKTPDEVEKPLQENSRSIDQKMEEAEVSDDQLARSNEPEFKGALDSKKEAQTQAQQGPQAVRAFEGEQVQQAQAEADGAAQTELQAMHGSRAAALTQVLGHQKGAKSQDEAARAKVAADIQQIYSKTKANVERILAKLDGEVDKAFDEGAEAAKKAFEDFVDARMTAYKDDRYGGWFGWARWAKDKLMGMPGEVNAFYSEGRTLYLQKMDAVINAVVAIIGRTLTEAKAEVANGQKEIQAYVKKLPADLRQVGNQASNEIQDKFSALESSIDAKGDELINRLANKYNESLKAVDARIEELKAANQGLVDKAINAVVGVVEAILKLKDLLLTVLAKVIDVVTKIIKDPIGFLGNLISGIKMGLENFITNLPKHLIDALVGWLTGALGPMGIKIPENLFSLEGIFSLVMQILGLTWDAIRAKAVKLLGEPAVKALETGFEIFKILITEGPAGLWKYVKEMFANLKEMVIDAITDLIKTEVVQAGIKWIMGLLTPAGAFIKAAMAIYDIVKFFIEKASQIGELINAIVDGVAAIASGSLGGAAKLIEDALARSLPIVIGFLANLLGIGDLAKKVQGIIEKIREKVDAGIDWVINKAVAVAKKIGSAVGGLFGGGKKKEEEAGDQSGSNEKAIQSARAMVTNVTKQPFNDENDLNQSIKQIEKGLIPEGLKSLQVSSVQGHAGQYKIVAREEVGEAQVGGTNGHVNVDTLRNYRPDFSDATKQELAAIYPDYHLSGTITILFEKAMSKKGELYNRTLFDRRHITAYSDLRNDLLNRVHGKEYLDAAQILQKELSEGIPPQSLTNESILEAIKRILSIKFNDINNLFVGDAKENQDRGRKMAAALGDMEQAAASGDTLAFNQAKTVYLAQGFDPEPVDYFYDKYQSLREKL